MGLSWKKKDDESVRQIVELGERMMNRERTLESQTLERWRRSSVASSQEVGRVENVVEERKVANSLRQEAMTENWEIGSDEDNTEAMGWQVSAQVPESELTHKRDFASRFRERIASVVAPVTHAPRAVQSSFLNPEDQALTSPQISNEINEEEEVRIVPVGKRSSSSSETISLTTVGTVSLQNVPPTQSNVVTNIAPPESVVAASVLPESSMSLGVPSSDPGLPVEDDLRKRFGANLRSALSHGTVIEGKMSFDSPVRIDGSLNGEISSTSTLIVGDQAAIMADLKVGTLVVLGRVRGNVTATDLVEIRRGGSLEGDISTKRIMIEDGGAFEGTCEIG